VETRTVVIVEDDADIQEALVTIFKQGGFEVHAFASGAQGVEAVREHCPQVLILDLNLPDIDGYEVARRVRLFSNTYILMLTARTHEMDTLLGLEAGADDYLTKPFRPRELRYRVEALLRRPRIRSDSTSLTASPLAAQPLTEAPSVPGPGPQPAETFEYNGLRLAVAARTVEVDGAEIRLTGSEFDILHALLRGGRDVLAKEDLIQVLRNDQAGADRFGRDADEQVIQVHIANLRRKLRDTASNPRWIETVHGFGYRLAATDTPSVLQP
jgi:DNA-binding response OmpR family regulator